MFPPPPTAQGVGSQTFTAPPIDGSLSVTQIIDHHFAKSPSHPLFRYRASDAPDSFEELCWRDVAPAIHRAAYFVKLKVQAISCASGAPIVGILSEAVNIPHSFALVYGVIRAGFPVQLISPYNSSTTAGHVLFTAGVTHLFVEDSLRDMVNTALELVKKEHPAFALSVLDLPTFDDLYPKGHAALETLPPAHAPDLDSVAMGIQSSGSTALPKIIWITHQALLARFRSPWYSELDLCGEVAGLFALQLCFSLGIGVTGYAIACGMVCAVQSPADAGTAFLPQSAIRDMAVTRCTLAFAYPVHVEAWVQVPGAAAVLSQLKSVQYCGAPLNKAIGDALTREGVPLTSRYGTSDIECVTMCVPARPTADTWEYFEFSPHVSPYFKPLGDGKFELYPASCATHIPSVFHTEIDGVPAYATKDIVIQHPQYPNKYAHAGRVDDLIVLGDAYQFYPVPLENIIKLDPRVKGVLLLGHGKPRTGLLIEPVDTIDASDHPAVSSYRDAIWEIVEKVNEIYQIEARIAKEMVILANPSKPFVYTAKGNPQRQKILGIYHDEIEAAYGSMASISI
ncbi:hypothetical protein BOTBODRAFT_410115 [Botryobasidium botryosum FD-172 SS1]|uniref:AMP-dependent synthetase/ligase domain-containing protein n=1 Tax=Botryobasidium botryosum (strain FD-172 SS1) TaxID=930990 RepID=A0A067MDJ0_BOTB1|nr:hypothetical protein BOTBODRAFT_410115 [Botryobasidium botryosum FD-172 SS1]